MSVSLPAVGISACLLGEPVRYDGAHQRQDALLADFAGKVEWIAVCPEVELGLGVPRETIQLEEVEGQLEEVGGQLEDVGGRRRLIASQTRRDLTDSMLAWTQARLADLPELAGYIFKARSPSCGLGSAPVHADGSTHNATDGLWAAALRLHSPTLPLAEEGDLVNAAQRGGFLRQVHACADLNELFHPGWAPADVHAFQARYPLRLSALSPEHAALLGRLVAAAAKTAPADFTQRYRRLFLAAIAAGAPRS